MTTYTLTLTASKMHVLSRAAEVLARLGMGQIHDALRELPKSDNIDWSAWHDDCEAVAGQRTIHIGAEDIRLNPGEHYAGLITRHRAGNATIFTMAERPNKRRKAA